MKFLFQLAQGSRKMTKKKLRTASFWGMLLQMGNFNLQDRDRLSCENKLSRCEFSQFFLNKTTLSHLLRDVKIDLREKGKKKKKKRIQGNQSKKRFTLENETKYISLRDFFLQTVTTVTSSIDNFSLRSTAVQNWPRKPQFIFANVATLKHHQW